MQLLRFATKAALAWYLVPADYGAVALAGLVAYLAAHVALLGLNEALVACDQVGSLLWERMLGLHRVSGLVLSALMALLGGVVYALAEDPAPGRFLMVLAPMVFVANGATLPTALLVRNQAYARLFRIDVVSALALSATTLGLAMAGAGPWSVAAGLYANAVVASVLARREAALFTPTGQDPGDAYHDVRAAGRRFCRAETSNAVGDQLDSLAVGALLSTTALSLYSYALTVGQVFVNYTTSLAERSLFPILADRQRQASLGPAYADALRVSLTHVVPVHLLIATLAEPLTAVLFPDAWAGVAPLLMVLSLASGVRCLDIVGSTALKASGNGHAVERLGFLRLGLLVGALAVSLPWGLEAVAWGVFVARLIPAAATLGRARGLLPADGLRQLLGTLRWLPLWALALLGGAWVVGAQTWGASSEPAVTTPLTQLLLLGAYAAMLWALLRWCLDRSALRRELRALRARWARSGGESIR